VRNGNGTGRQGGGFFGRLGKGGMIGGDQAVARKRRGGIGRRRDCRAGGITGIAGIGTVGRSWF
jgi:hypothetical protein